ncbi:hypothetical protein [Thermoflavimicrobium dichotomicum]|uniref:Uncharacterized protein n=1 Tax=Thermoflavimicrobium dichotomicum TaxID=46223 RepID=A0A1I3SB08_9BACL|nr:hypothetical protein [Thermoflavimicrobium dichotomicum]SFJ54686.1 hypothetical protein SAMN05421852_11254 [Thermoflavimicrobium dichotomicum]
MEKQFEIRLLKQYFSGDMKYDLCSHGEIFLRIGDTILSDHEDGEWNISESALALLRTVVSDFPSNTLPKYYFEGIEEEVNLIHHCGCFMLFCPICIGWKVTHQGQKVVLTDFQKNEGEMTYPNLSVTLPLREYATEIYHFAIEAKKLFEGHNKIVKNNELFDGQYQWFWEEYDELLETVQSIVT